MWGLLSAVVLCVRGLECVVECVVEFVVARKKNINKTPSATLFGTPLDTYRSTTVVALPVAMHQRRAEQWARHVLPCRRDATLCKDPRRSGTRGAERGKEKVVPGGQENQLHFFNSRQQWRAYRNECISRGLGGVVHWWSMRIVLYQPSLCHRVLARGLLF